MKNLEKIDVKKTIFFTQTSKNINKVKLKVKETKNYLYIFTRVGIKFITFVLYRNPWLLF